MPAPKHLPSREILAIAPPGLESVLAEELASLGWPAPHQHPGAVGCTGGSDQLMRACLWCRCATDLRVRVGRGPASSLESLAQGLRKLPWSLFLKPGQAVEISVSSRGSRLKRRDAVARKASLAIGDALRGPRITHGRQRGRHDRDVAPAQVHLRIEGDRVQASIDPVGTTLWKRGYRERGGAAPLRENLAAAALRAMEWRPHEPLVDPCTGSGTILIEAASIARGLAPGVGRRFAMERWPCHDRRSWDRMLEAARRPGPSAPLPPLIGADADDKVLELARTNAKRAGVAGDLRWLHQRVDALEPPSDEPGLVLCNPPWGRRLGKRVAGVYDALGRSLRQRFAGWRVGVLCPDRALVRALRLPMEPRLRFPHGGQTLTLWAGPVG
jgi:putative N6-adenine-specific DNA methylase